MLLEANSVFLNRWVATFWVTKICVTLVLNSDKRVLIFCFLFSVSPKQTLIIMCLKQRFYESNINVSGQVILNSCSLVTLKIG